MSDESLNGLGNYQRAVSHMLRDVARESDNLENDDDFEDFRYELADHYRNINLLTQEIEHHKKTISLHEEPSITHSATEGISSSPQPSPKIAYDEEDHDNDASATNPLLLADYVLIALEDGTKLLDDPFESVEVLSIVHVNSFPLSPPTFLFEVGGKKRRYLQLLT